MGDPLSEPPEAVKRLPGFGSHVKVCVQIVIEPTIIFLFTEDIHITMKVFLDISQLGSLADDSDLFAPIIITVVQRPLSSCRPTRRVGSLRSVYVGERRHKIRISSCLVLQFHAALAGCAELERGFPLGSLRAGLLTFEKHGAATAY